MFAIHASTENRLVTSFDFSPFYSQVKANISNLQDRMGTVESSVGIQGAPPPPPAGRSTRDSGPGTDVIARSKLDAADRERTKSEDRSGQTPRDPPRGQRKTPRQKPGGTRSRVSQGSKGEQGAKSRGRRPKQDLEGADSQVLSDRASLQSSAITGIGESDHVDNK